MDKTKNLTLKYTGMMAAYNMAYACFAAYGTVFLLAKDFNESEIGLIVAVANIFAAVIQPLVADWADRSRKWTLKEFNLLFIIPVLLLLLSNRLNSQAFFLVGIQFMLSYTILLTLQPLLNAVSMFLINHGYDMNYGVARGIGSLFFAMSSALLGIVTVRWGMDSVTSFTLLAFSLYLLALLSLPLRWIKANPQSGIDDEQPPMSLNEVEMPVDISAVPVAENFFQRYPNFMIVNIGIVMFFIFHSLVNTYMFQVLANVGGDSSDMGWAYALGALVEIPIMFSYSALRRYISDEKAMMISAVFFFVKAVATLLAVNVIGIFAAQAVQSLAFALYITVSVLYTNKVMQAQDKVKGQAVLTTSHTIGGIIGSLSGGVLIQNFSVQVALLFCVVVTLIGAISFWIGLRPSILTAAPLDRD